eukprot:TRINITY_DN10363_c0_g4_i2.p1 TRINITY_DN10363_c0_g4~~TRINITY_DN10363_c0_g4_i2.p1  ORF type:complete len:103 (-),score=13.50 TRINITY_DN10363_c0_g4_i2:226-534(-)
MSPPMGILKLNFDESFVKSLDKGGIGGVIRDWSSKIVRSFSGPVESSDTNEAEVFALLIGCRELPRLGDWVLYFITSYRGQIQRPIIFQRREFSTLLLFFYV